MIATATITNLPKIQFAKNWQTTEYSSDHTVVEINFRTATIEVFRMTTYEMTSIPTRIYNGHATWFKVDAGMPKSEIVDMICAYGADIVDVMAGYEHGPIEELSMFATNEIADRWRYIRQGLEWALGG